ncbi:hypothetical protein KC959_04360, partial [Candidatus Saccharibacteria bacterium]|nr:hypothetical protein [Candidatus Saccharibacteria bacterium]
KQFLESFDAATPKGFVVHTSRQLDKALRRLSYPVVIKPAQGSRGRHSHILINDQEQAVSAFKSAKKICAFVMCEEMLHGSVYRFTTVNGKVVAVLRGDYPSVIGDGQHTVRQLLAKKNANRAAQISEVKITKSLRGLLEKQSTKLDSIPEKGEQVLLGQKIGVLYGGDAVEVTSHTHPTFTAGLERVAEKIPLFILGFDVIAEDITKPDIEQKWGIIEINTVPFINLHHYPRSGKPVDVASIVWREIRRQFQE